MAPPASETIGETITQSMPMAMALPVADELPVYQGHAVTAPLSASAPPSSHSKLSEEQIKRLMEQGYTRGTFFQLFILRRASFSIVLTHGFFSNWVSFIGLAQSLESTKKVFSRRIWIVDNSGSMQKCDGHRMAETKNRNTVKMVPCSRWEEITECVSYHIQLAGLLEAPSRFRVSETNKQKPLRTSLGIRLAVSSLKALHSTYMLVFSFYLLLLPTAAK